MGGGEGNGVRAGGQKHPPIRPLSPRPLIAGEDCVVALGARGQQVTGARRRRSGGETVLAGAVDADDLHVDQDRLVHRPGAPSGRSGRGVKKAPSPTSPMVQNAGGWVGLDCRLGLSSLPAPLSRHSNHEGGS